MKKAIAMLVACILCMTMSLPTLAYSYEFSGSVTTLGKPTDTDEPVTADPMQENVRRDKEAAEMPPPHFYGSGIIPTEAVNLYFAKPSTDGYLAAPSSAPGIAAHTAHTASGYFADGSIGRLSIPSLGIYMNAYEGATTGNMNRGVAHFAETSAWDGNIGLAGHNRGSNYNIGTINNLSIGDTITYTTPLGSRTYKVSFVGTIAETDWTNLAATADNRITLITCLANQPTMRVCVQAVAV